MPNRADRGRPKSTVASHARATISSPNTRAVISASAVQPDERSSAT
jgi:hypothetical protein